MSDVVFRPFAWSDVPAIHAIYRPYVEETTITFETEVPAETEMAERLAKVQGRGWAWLVAEHEDATVLGYAYYTQFRDRSGYRHCAEDAIYVRDDVRGQGFNVGQTAHNYRIRDIAEIVADVVPNCTIELASDAGPDTRSYRVSFDKIARVLPAFQPQWDARKGAEQLYAAYRRSGVTLEEFEGPRYKRIAHIRKLLGGGDLDADLRAREPELA